MGCAALPVVRGERPVSAAGVPKWWVVRAGAIYTVVRDDTRLGRGTRLARWASTREQALASAERAATRHARQASGGRKGRYVVERHSDAFEVVKVE